MPDHRQIRLRQHRQGEQSQEATGNLCLGSRAVEQERVGKFLFGLANRTASRSS